MKKIISTYITSLSLLIILITYNTLQAQVITDSAKTRRFVYIKVDSIYYESNHLTLKAYLLKPSGNGPFPVYMWNHGSEKDPRVNLRVARFWVDHGFIFFAPVRSGHGDNAGLYIVDEEKKILAERLSLAVAFNERVKLHEKENDDVIAACSWISKQPFTDASRMVISGGSYGGIQTLLTAERDAQRSTAAKCFIVMSPAAMSWNDRWAERLSKAMNSAKKPVFLLQAENDFNTGPSEILGPLADAKGSPSRHKLFPAHLVKGRDPNDHMQGHAGFFNDPSAWQEEVLQYLKDCGVYLPR